MGGTCCVTAIPHVGEHQLQKEKLQSSHGPWGRGDGRTTSACATWGGGGKYGEGQQEALRKRRKVPLLFYIRYERNEERKEKGKKILSHLSLVKESSPGGCPACSQHSHPMHSCTELLTSKQQGGTRTLHFF